MILIETNIWLEGLLQLKEDLQVKILHECLSKLFIKLNNHTTSVYQHDNKYMCMYIQYYVLVHVRKSTYNIMYMYVTACTYYVHVHDCMNIQYYVLVHVVVHGEYTWLHVLCTCTYNIMYIYMYIQFYVHDCIKVYMYVQI